jgi:acyl dehydratase
MKYFEEISVGESIDLGSHTFTAEAIKSFATRFDPQPFHLDEAAAARSHFGGLCASGWHTVALWMRLRVDQFRQEEDERRSRGEPSARLGPSPGFRDLKWLRPVFAGDTITYATEVVELRPLNTRPGWGMVTSRCTGTNQHGDLVLSFLGIGFVERQP